AGAAETRPLLAQQIEEHRQRLVVRDAVGIGYRRTVQVARDAALADAFHDGAALGAQLAVLDVVVHRGAHRVGRRDHHTRLALLQVLADAGQRATGADRTDEGVDAAVRLPPDLRAGRADVAVAVGQVVPRVRIEDAVRRAAGG